MLDQIPATHKVYINTTLPVSEHQTEADILAFAERNKHKITCINVSRHMQHYVVESNDSLLSKLPVPFRVNCVLYKNYPADQLVPYMERFRRIPGASIQFRFDYTRHHAGEPVRRGQRPDPPGPEAGSPVHGAGRLPDALRLPLRLQGHGADLSQDLPYSTIVEKDPADGVTYDILYDILIKQNGDIHSDWDGTVMDVDAYEKVVFEPYDLKWLKKDGVNSGLRAAGHPRRPFSEEVFLCGPSKPSASSGWAPWAPCTRTCSPRPWGGSGSWSWRTAAGRSATAGRGPLCNGRLRDFRYVDAGELAEPVDLLLFAVKFGGLEGAVETCRHLVGPDTVVISVLNASPVRRSWARPTARRRWSGAWPRRCPPRRRGTPSPTAPPESWPWGSPPAWMTPPSAVSPAFFDRIGFAYSLPADIRVHQWSKLLCNTGCNQAAMVFQCDYSILHRPAGPGTP